MSSWTPSTETGLVLNGMLMSQPSRAVWTLLTETGSEFTFHNVDMFKGEQTHEEFVKMNPNHKMPVLQDGDFTLWESNSILRYLCDKLGLESWYPKDLQQRAKVNQFLDWHHLFLRATLTGVLNETMLRGLVGKEGRPVVLADRIEAANEALERLNGFLAHGKFIAGGDKPTIADLACGSEVYQVPIIAPHVTLDKYPNVVAWQKKLVESVKCWKEGTALFDGYMASQAAKEE